MVIIGFLAELSLIIMPKNDRGTKSSIEGGKKFPHVIKYNEEN